MKGPGIVELFVGASSDNTHRCFYPTSPEGRASEWSAFRVVSWYDVIPVCLGGMSPEVERWGKRNGTVSHCSVVSGLV